MKKSDLQRTENCLSFRGEEKYVLAQVIHQCDIFGYPQIRCIKFCHHCCTVNVCCDRTLSDFDQDKKPDRGGVTLALNKTQYMQQLQGSRLATTLVLDGCRPTGPPPAVHRVCTTVNLFSLCKHLCSGK